MLIPIHPETPQERNLTEVANRLRKGQIMIYPTDSVYAFGCAISEKNAIEKICQLRKVDPKKSNFSIICSDISQLTDYAKQISTPIFRIIKQCLPGPYTFIFKSSNEIPKIFKNKRKTIGIRVPDHVIPVKIVDFLGEPILTASLKEDDDIMEYLTDPELIHEKYGALVDFIIDGGFGKNEPSTVIDVSEDEAKVIREGLGPIDML